jgi:hypothetical protein
VESRERELGKGKGAAALLYFTWNRSMFNVFSELDWFYMSLTRFDQFYSFLSFKPNFACFICFFTSQNAILITLVKSIHNFKWWKFSSRVHIAIIYKLYKWQIIFPIICRSCVKVLLTTSVCSSVWRWQVVENNSLVRNLPRKTFQK